MTYVIYFFKKKRYSIDVDICFDNMINNYLQKYIEEDYICASIIIYNTGLGKILFFYIEDR